MEGAEGEQEREGEKLRDVGDGGMRGRGKGRGRGEGEGQRMGGAGRS